MDTMLTAVYELFHHWKDRSPESVEVLPPSGSDRRYFRIHDGEEAYMACVNNHVRENETFFYFTEHFRKAGIHLPVLCAVSESKQCYIVEDLGDTSLLNCIEQEGHSPRVFDLFKKSLSELACMQIKGEQGLDYQQCITSREFGKQAIMADLLYFKYYFLDTLKIPYDKEKLIEDFDALSTYLSYTGQKYFMFRDFQSRNIMIRNEQPYFIDYQGGMKGALQYDVASLLWQAKAELPDQWKTELLQHYMKAADELLPSPLDHGIFVSQYNGYVLIRLLQVLGAYGFRGLFERKAHFLTSIPLALENLRSFLKSNTIGMVLPIFDSVLREVVDPTIEARFKPIQANENTPLVVKICSFSYRNGFPADATGHGGGFVFDCRGILNPGRFEPYKTLTGRDKPVKDFLEQKTRMTEFLQSVTAAVDIAVEDYIQRGFDALSIGFGCTGGQHRSVYAADALARHLKNKYKVNIELQHLVQDAKNWIN
jgi:aminoglycoside/choline kinase family phosphotransferase